MSNCPFCTSTGQVKIIRENEDAYLIAALDSTNSLMPGCYLVIPKIHVESVIELPERWHARLVELLVHIPEFAAGVPFNLSYNQGRAAGQRVSHVHGWVVFREGEAGTAAYEKGLKALIERCKSIHPL
jgi:diadenosine tetraphosphate (Ap4A) HIT family hydrolase